MTKSNGFEFWRTTLNSAKLVVAPMVDHSELAWRMLSRQYGADLCYTPMFHAAMFVRDPSYRKECMQTCKEDRPLIVQFCANDPEIFLQAAKLAQHMCDAIDLNLGCPQFIARRGHYGAFLQDEWDLLEKMVSLCNKELSVPITCKIRIFDSLDKSIKYAQMLERAGCQLLTIHGRTKEQKGPLTGLANWEFIKAVRESLTIPVFANGNIQYLSDVTRCMEKTNVQGVMTAEGNLHNPALFTGQAPLIWKIVSEYLDLVDQYPCPIGYIRGHVFKILHHALCHYHDVREEVASAKTVEDFRLANKHIEERCQDDMIKYAESAEELLKRTSLPLPYWMCQPYLRPGPDPITDENKRAERAKINLKRESDMKALPIEGLSKNKMKKILRNPKKMFRQARIFEPCMNCTSPKSGKCVHEMCKSCCKEKAFKEVLDCDGHRIFYRTQAEKRKQSEENESKEMHKDKNGHHEICKSDEGSKEDHLTDLETKHSTIVNTLQQSESNKDTS